MSFEILKSFSFPLAFILAACSTTPHTITKNAQSDEVRKGILIGIDLPSDCKSVTKVFPPGKTTFDVRYREPEHNQNGKPANLAYTTIYMKSSNGMTKAIKIPSKDPDGGASVQVLDIPVPGSEIELCVTATNVYGKESHAAAWEPRK